MLDLRGAFQAQSVFGMPQAPEDAEPVGEWLTVKEVAAWLKVSEHHVYQTIRRMPGCEPINVGRSQKQPDLRFNRYKLAAALALNGTR
ncbi:MAG: hypothetical protein ACSLE3_01410 [Microbacteriaceae bacterium]